VVNAQYTFGVETVSAIPLDDQHPAPRQLVRRFDGGDGAIYLFDAVTQTWRHIPDLATFQAQSLYWCDITSADAGMFGRMRTGAALPPVGGVARGDYPSCRPPPPVSPPAAPAAEATGDTTPAAPALDAPAPTDSSVEADVPEAVLELVATPSETDPRN
jgi:hypothetical protein